MTYTSLSNLLDETLCPLCQSHNHELIYSDKRIAGSLGEIPINVVQCNECGFIYNSPRLGTSALSRYYAEETLASGQVYRDESSNSHYPRLNLSRASYLASYLSFLPSGRILDVGCGTGGFLTALSSVLKNWQLSGLDPSLNAVDVCDSKGLAVRRGSLGDSISNLDQYDAISLVSVLEHLPDPLAGLAWCFKNLRTNGLLFLEVPDTRTPEISLTGFFNFEHIVHFTESTLYSFLRSNGFIDIRRDRNAAGVIRLVASSNLSVWGMASDPTPPDDRLEARRSVLEYAVDEKVLIDGLRLRVSAALENWSSRNLKIAVYGAGLHTQQLATLVNLESSVFCYLDGDPKKHGKSFLGKQIFSPTHLDALDIDAVLISSNRFVDEMSATARRYGGTRIELLTCYE